MTDMPRMIRQQQLTSSIAQQLLQELNTGSGWDELSLEAVPVGDDISATVRQRTGDEVVSNAGVLARDLQLSKDVMSLREATYEQGAGAWISAVITISASGWPEPKLSPSASFNYDSDPFAANGAEATLSAETLAADLTRFPRQRANIPQWVVDRIGAAGLEVPAMSAGE
ncbi:hypothetical protein [Spelaeicoccus albus]|uniref:Uncharacterized protein n=1 Tax=Spelaeicoccus albus TaxID=1280376 RepID=A0A7Z0AB00_9MICO|nr:hypothetical protein [Spelaeicoccus albus]NYI66810.1 hypothetical protein [Spelaeicoccus albus]